MSREREYNWHVKDSIGACPVCGCPNIPVGREHRRVMGMNIPVQYEQRYGALIEPVPAYQKPSPIIRPIG